MIKYKKRIIENQSHGRNTTHLVKSMNGVIRPPSIITCFGSFRLNIRPPIERGYQVGEEWITAKSYFKYSRNDGPIKTVVIDIQAVFDDPLFDGTNNDAWTVIDLQLAELEKDLCRGADGVSLAFYLNSNRSVEWIDIIPDINLHDDNAMLARMIEDNNDVRYTLSGISGNGEFPITDMYNKQIRDIAIPFPMGMILDLPDPDVYVDHPRWYPGNTLSNENNKLTIYPSEHTDEVAFDLFEALGGDGVEPLVITSCVAASPRLYQCMNTAAGGANMLGGEVYRLNTFDDNLDMSTLEFEEVRSPNYEYYTPYPLASSPWAWGVEATWPPVNINGEMLYRNFICKYSKNNEDVKTVRWSTHPRFNGQHSVWNAIKELILDDTGKTAFGLLDFNISNGDYKYGNNLVKTGISSNANILMTSRYGNHLDSSPLTRDFSAVVIRDGVITFTTDYEGFSWSENTLTIYPTVQDEMPRENGEIDYYKLLCETYEQITEGLPIVIHSCGVVEPVNHVQVDTKLNLNSNFLTSMTDPNIKLSYTVKLNNGEVKQILQEKPGAVSFSETLSAFMQYVMFMGKPITYYDAHSPETIVPERYINKLYFRQEFGYNDLAIAGCSGIEREYDDPQSLVKFTPDGNSINTDIQILPDLNSTVPTVTESNSVTFVKSSVPGYVDFFDIILDTVGSEHTIYSTAIVPAVARYTTIDGGEPPIEPPVGDKSDDFIFSIKNYENSESVVTLRIKGDVPGADLSNWYLEDLSTNQIVASSGGSTSNGVQLDIVRGYVYNATIIIRYSDVIEHRYKLHGSVPDLSVTTTTDTTTVNEPVGLLDIQSYGINTKAFNFSARSTDLQVPTDLAPHLTNTKYMFAGSIFFNQDLSNWNTINIVNMSGMFSGCSNYNQDISMWNTSNVVSMENMFQDFVFNVDNPILDISNLDVSNVTNMREMFRRAYTFNQDISQWNTSHVVSMENMFYNCSTFNQDIGIWDTSNVIDMSGMFSGCHVFNQDIGGWNVSNVSNMSEMFACINFNQDLSKWCVSLIGYKPQNGFDLNDNPNWTLPKPIWGTCPSDVPIVTGDTMVFTIDPDDTIPINSRFYITLGNAGDNWLLSDATGVVASPTDRESDFILSDSYPTKQLIISNLVVRAGEYTLTTTSDRIDLQFGNGGVGIADPVNMRVNVSKFSDTVTSYGFVLPTTLLTVPTVLPRSVTNCEEMFQYCKYFNQDISMWDMSNVTNMIRMFNHAHLFNHSLNTWDVSNVVTMEDMFLHAYGFNGAIGDWNTSKVTDMHSMFNAARTFNQDIGNWNVSNVTNMEGMFFDTPKFNQNLSGWCVTNIPVIPSSFTYYENIWTLPKPVWGTCPSVENPEILDPTVFNAEVKLNTISYQHKTDIVLDISIDSSDWEVYFNNDLVASSTVGSADGQPVQKVGNKVTINPNFLNALITVKGTMSNLGFKVVTHPQVDPVVNISHFSNTISSYAINTGFAPLSVPTILPSVVNSMAMMFNGTRNVVSDITNWDTTNINDMQYLFSDCAAFNQDIGSWNTSAVTNMEGLFREAWLFNGNIGQWDTSNVVNMTYMFTNSHAFNQDLSGWNVAKISNKPEGFGDEWLSDWVLPKPLWGTVGTPIVPPVEPELPSDSTYKFSTVNTREPTKDLPIIFSITSTIGDWSLLKNDVVIASVDVTDTPGVTVESFLAGNYDIIIESDFDVEANYEFKGTTDGISLLLFDDHYPAPNDNIGSVTVSSFASDVMYHTFSLHGVNLTVPNVLPRHMTDLSNMFAYSSAFNQDLSMWDVSLVDNMMSMFENCGAYNQDLSSWNTPLISVEPDNFAVNANAWVLLKPQWGADVP